MEQVQNLDLPASKADIQMVLEAIRNQIDPGLDLPENSVFLALWKRLDQIEKASKLKDLPIDAETASAITGLAVGTVKKYGCYRHIDTIRIGNKLQFSLRSCIQLVERGSRKALIDCTTEITNYRRKKRTPKKTNEGRHGKESGKQERV